MQKKPSLYDSCCWENRVSRPRQLTRYLNVAVGRAMATRAVVFLCNSIQETNNEFGKQRTPIFYFHGVVILYLRLSTKMKHLPTSVIHIFFCAPFYICKNETHLSSLLACVQICLLFYTNISDKIRNLSFKSE